MENYLTRNPNQTKKLGESFAKKILRSKLPQKAFVLALVGDLGGGKTTFVQGFAKGLGIREKILSPTFILMKKFSIPSRTFIHIDCYRIKKPKELLDLEFGKIVSDPKNIIAIEWADKIKKIIPKGSTILKFEFINKETRKIVIELKNAP